MSDLPARLRKMLVAKQLERVAENPAHAAEIVATAQRHVRTARTLAGTEDHEMAFTAAYDGARKALTAVLAVHGLRVRAVGGAHRNTGVAAAEFVTDPALAEFEWMRQVRNATEYPSADRPGASRQDVEEGIEAAAAIAEACATYLSRHAAREG